MKRIAGMVFAAAAVFATAAFADPATVMQSPLGLIVVAPNGRTLYAYDKDTRGGTTSACTGQCIANWPPFVAPSGAKAEGAWSLVDVTDKNGTAEKMWAYEGQPLYFYKNDKAPGDTAGNGVGGVWHVVQGNPM
jgi:predicted lipoprotein with Yx(FWY)xxD motif